jgi:hypothetical protein
MTAQELWLYFVSIGGNVEELEVSAYLNGPMPLLARKKEQLIVALAEM